MGERDEGREREMRGRGGKRGRRQREEGGRRVCVMQPRRVTMETTVSPWKQPCYHGNDRP